MQIFSPHSNFIDISNCLDNKRLNKQKIEIFQIINCIVKGDGAKGWRHHPAVKMARGHEHFFINYGLEIAHECIRRGFKDTMIPKIAALKEHFSPQTVKVPKYWSNEKFHASHRAALLAKKYDWYSKFGWKEEAKIDYFWPI